MQLTIPIDIVKERIRQGEPLRFVPLAILGWPGRPKECALMLGGDHLSDTTGIDIFSTKSLIEQPTDSDGITSIQLFE